MKTDIFNCNNYENFVEQLRSIFLEAEGKVQFVECPVRMGKTCSSERYIIDFLKSRRCEIENEILIFATEKNLLVDSSFLEIKKKLSETEQSNLLVFKKETSEKCVLWHYNNKHHDSHLLGTFRDAYINNDGLKFHLDHCIPFYFLQL